MGTITLRNVRKAFGEAVIIPGADLDIAHGEFVVFVGPSGCGKSTLLRLIAGLEDLTSGEIMIDGEDVTDVPPAKRGLAMVFQSYALYPHMSVRNNIAFGLKMAGETKEQIDAKVAHAAATLNLSDYLDRKPRQLSGGQRQRVAIGRAIVRQPRIFLFDEPLSNLDAALRTEMRIELMDLHQRLGSTMIYVTHDQVEAMTMADKIVVLNAGRIEQVGTPLELYHHPRNRFVAGFIGNPTMNFIAGRCTAAEAGKVTVELPKLGTLTLNRSAPHLAGESVTIGIRPEHVDLGGGEFSIDITPRIIEHLGIHTVLYADLQSGEQFTSLFEGDTDAVEGRPLRLGWSSGHVHLFDKDGVAVE